ncbi:MAG: transglutaminase domain-containing protein [Kofleriaceae bacterium]
MRAICLVTLFACTAKPHVDAPDLAPADRHYTIWLGGARIGTAVEHETRSSTGLVLLRTEAMRFRRGDATITIATDIEIEADHTLAPRRVHWIERGPLTREATATRDAARWTIEHDGEISHLAGSAIPAELVPLFVRRDGKFAGRVFLPARAFVAGAGRVEPVAPARLVARLALDGGALAEATIDLDSDGSYERVVDGEGVIAIRATPAQAALAFEPVDLIAATAIPITGTRSDRIVLDGTLTLPALPGQASHAHDGGIALELSARLPGDLDPAAHGRDRSHDIVALVAQVQARIAPDLAAGLTSARDAIAAKAGDCTTFALVYAALASRQRIETHVVTGLRIDGDRLVRHRWAVSWTGRSWIAVDAAYGAVPAGGDLIGLAVHDADDAGLVAGEAALTMVHAAAWR